MIKRRQRGFTLLLGMLLLLGMTLIGISLVDRGLWDTRSAARVQQDSTAFQQTDSRLEQLAADASVPADGSGGDPDLRRAMLALAHQGECLSLQAPDSQRTHCVTDDDDYVALQRLDNPCLDERLVRNTKSSSGLVSCRYFDARIATPPKDASADSNHFNPVWELHRGLRGITISAVSDRLLIIPGEGS